MTVVVGIDCGKDRVDAVAIENDAVINTFTVDLAKEKPQRSRSLYSMRESLWLWIRHIPTPNKGLVVYVELPIVMRNPKVALSLAMTVGMVFSLPCHVHGVDIDSWKKEVAKAGLSKDAIRRIITGRYPVQANLFRGRQDLFDAFGVALYGAQDQLFRAGLGSTPITDPA